jgi:hypothetical protein
MITWPNNTTEITDDIRNVIGRYVTIYSTASGIACTASGCFLDPVTNLSTNSLCPTCSGFYWINTVSGLQVKAYIRMPGVDIPIYTVGGYIVNGDAEIQIKYTTQTINVVNNMRYVVVDGKTFVKKDISLRGVPTVNRIVISLDEKEE